ncbi:MAG TPA: glycosyltransferase [Nocardioidaceae bacterium]|nr:glycosyltransferase [Nocardioidaceae bacterium]
MSHYLIASVPIHGHVSPLLAVAAGLVARGHTVRFLTGARFSEVVERTGSAFVALPEEGDYDDRLLASANEDRPSGLAGLRYDVAESFLAPARPQYDALTGLEVVPGLVEIEVAVPRLRPAEW